MAEYGAPLFLSQNIVAALNAADANGTLGSIATGGGIASVHCGNLPGGFVIPANALLSQFITFNNGAGNVNAFVGIGIAPGYTQAATKLVYIPITAISFLMSSPIGGVYNNGAAGVGATIDTGNPTLTVDGPNIIVNGQRVIVTAEVNPAHNGLYVASGVGVDVILTRSTAFDHAGNMNGGVMVTDVNSSRRYVVNSPDVVTPGTDPVTWTPMRFLSLTGLNQANSHIKTNTAVTAGQNRTLFADYTVGFWNPHAQLTAYIMAGENGAGVPNGFSTADLYVLIEMMAP